MGYETERINIIFLQIEYDRVNDSSSIVQAVLSSSKPKETSEKLEKESDSANFSYSMSTHIPAQYLALTPAASLINRTIPYHIQRARHQTQVIIIIININKIILMMSIDQLYVIA